MAKLWVISDALQPADAAVVLGGGTDTRPYAAAQLYQRGLVKLILVSNAPPHDLTSDLSDQLAQAADDDLKVLFSLGIPTDAIASLGTGLSNTYDEARAAADWARRTKAQRVIVPTEIFPSRRVHWIFNRELRGVGTQVIIEAVPSPAYGTADWWQRSSGISVFESEAIKYLYYRLSY